METQRKTIQNAGVIFLLSKRIPLRPQHPDHENRSFYYIIEEERSVGWWQRFVLRGSQNYSCSQRNRP